MKKQYRQTSKLYYGEYLYKIEIWNPLAHIFRTEIQGKGKLKYCREQLDSYLAIIKSGGQVHKTRYRFTMYVEDETVFDAAKLYNYLYKTRIKYKLRVENNAVSLYTNSERMLQHFEKEDFSDTVVFHKPSEISKKALLGESKIIVINSPTEYPIRVTFGRKPANQGLLTFIQTNLNKTLTASSHLIDKLSNNVLYIDNNYIHVKNEKTLVLLELVCGYNIAKIEKLVYIENKDK